MNANRPASMARHQPVPLDLQPMRSRAHPVSSQASGSDALPPSKPLPVAHQTRLQRRLARRMGAGVACPVRPSAKGVSMSIWIITALACLVLGLAVGALWSAVKESLTAACVEFEQ